MFERECQSGHRCQSQNINFFLAIVVLNIYFLLFIQDSVIILDSCLSNINTVPESVEKQKNLKSLNDVLGKQARDVKTTKKSRGI